MSFRDKLEANFGPKLSNFYKTCVSYTVLTGVINREQSITTLNSANGLALFRMSANKQETWKSKHTIQREQMIKKMRMPYLGSSKRPQNNVKNDGNKKFFVKRPKFDLNK